MSCEIQKRQSSYWDILDRDGKTRIHFLGKEEFLFSTSQIPDFTIVDEHPLLLDYQLPWRDVYISSPAVDPERTVKCIAEAWIPYLKGWRSAFVYLADTDPIRMLGEGFGQLISAPEILAAVGTDILTEANVTHKSIPGRPASGPKKVLLAGQNYVIAKEFRIEHDVA